MRHLAVAAFAVLFVLLSGCSKDKEPVVALKVVPLIGTWQLISPDSSYGITLSFVVDRNNPPVDVTPFIVDGRSSVNTYNGRIYAAADGMMYTSSLGSTKVAGTSAAMQFEETYLANLKTVARFEVTAQDQLRLYHGGDKPGILIYARLK